MRPSVKCRWYISKMISSGKWEVDRRIPTIKTLCKKLGVSYPTIRNMIRTYEKRNILTKVGRDFYVKDPNISRKLDFLKTAKSGINSARLIEKGGIRIEDWIMKMINSNIEAVNIVSGKKLNVSVDKLLNIYNHNKSLDDILKIKNSNHFNKALINYKEAKKLKGLASAFVINKERFHES